MKKANVGNLFQREPNPVWLLFFIMFFLICVIGALGFMFFSPVPMWLYCGWLISLVLLLIGLFVT